MKVAGWWSLSLSPSVVKVREAVSWSLSLCLSFYRSDRGGWVAVSLSLFPSIVKVRVAGWWSLSLSLSIVNVRPLSL